MEHLTERGKPVLCTRKMINWDLHCIETGIFAYTKNYKATRYVYFKYNYAHITAPSESQMEGNMLFLLVWKTVNESRYPVCHMSIQSVGYQRCP